VRQSWPGNNARARAFGLQRYRWAASNSASSPPAGGAGRSGLSGSIPASAASRPGRPMGVGLSEGASEEPGASVSIMVACGLLATSWFRFRMYSKRVEAFGPWGSRIDEPPVPPAREIGSLPVAKALRRSEEEISLDRTNSTAGALVSNTDAGDWSAIVRLKYRAGLVLEIPGVPAACGGDADCI